MITIIYSVFQGFSTTQDAPFPGPNPPETRSSKGKHFPFAEYNLS
jgi:hypothetical protein